MPLSRRVPLIDLAPESELRFRWLSALWRCAEKMRLPPFTAQTQHNSLKNVFQSLLLVIAGATQKELDRQVKYPKVKNQILRSRLPKRIMVTPQERVRLVKFAPKLTGKVLRQLTTIFAPSMSTVRKPWTTAALGVSTDIDADMRLPPSILVRRRLD